MSFKIATLAFAIVLAGALPFGVAYSKQVHVGEPPTALGPAGATLIIIRHAEKPDGGAGLSEAGKNHARAYVAYFQNLEVDGALLHLDNLVATADSHQSIRPRLTLQPLADATGLPLQQPFANNKVDDLAQWLVENAANKTTLISWHHGKMVRLLNDLGADVPGLMPGGHWPSDVYDWTIELKFDQQGRVIYSHKAAQ
jgi:hypothetical protein